MSNNNDHCREVERPMPPSILTQPREARTVINPISPARKPRHREVKATACKELITGSVGIGTQDPVSASARHTSLRWLRFRAHPGQNSDAES